MAIRDPWEPRQNIERSYFYSLQEIVEYLIQASKDITDPYMFLQVLRHALNAPKINRFAEQASKNMVTHVFTDGSKTWRAAARNDSKGKIIYEALRKELQGPVGDHVAYQIQRNAEIIKTLPLSLADQVTKYIARETAKDRRAEDIARDIQRMIPENSRAKALLIARTEVSKTSTALTRARAQDIGLEWYEWRTSEDSRVRSSHRKMDHVLIRWSDPPAPELLVGEKSQGHYGPGEIYNCRCYPAPVINFDRLSWPHKVYMNGQIQSLSLSKVKAIGRTIAA